MKTRHMFQIGFAVLLGLMVIGHFAGVEQHSPLARPAQATTTMHPRDAAEGIALAMVYKNECGSVPAVVEKSFQESFDLGVATPAAVLAATPSIAATEAQWGKAMFCSKVKPLIDQLEQDVR